MSETPVEKGKMAAIATLINPMNPKKVMMFSTAMADYKLRYENRLINGDISVALGGTNAGPTLGYPSQLWATMYKDTDGVVKVHEATLSSSEKSKSPVLEINSIQPKTSLSFLHDSKANYRFLIYQQADGTIALLNMVTRNTSTIKGSKKDAAKPTSIGAVIVPGDAAANRSARIVVYFIGADEYLYSANSVLKEAPSFTEAGEGSSSVGNGYLVLPFSQLSPVLDADKQQTVVYAMNTEAEFTPIKDSWKSLR
ncbi:hypothetical protein BKA56DRAFT_506547 [Ilyonectria sp. MPI-CAGE-AT-0026]|nr:hypothetical protein BKA56DRAFT_506547 [Ilyonectria sp. MPI-CAGE-AT-0026]